MMQLADLQPRTTELRESYGASVVVCTRNRGESIRSTIATILANTHPSFELIIIDQSTNNTTEQVATSFGEDPRLRYIRSNTRGLSKARNIGWAEARSEIVLMTDDDCDVPEDWIARMTALFTRYPQVACIFCDVVAGPHDYSKGFIPIHIHKREMMVRRVEEYQPGAGMGAGMGLRRSAVQDLGGFDQLLGAGVELASAEDLDMTLRILLSGRHVCHTKSVSVVHHGFRSYAESRDLIRGYIYGQSALYAKLLRCGHWRVLPLYLKSIHMNVTAVVITSLRQRQIPRVLGRIVYLAKGFVRGWQLPVNRAKALFLPTDPDHHPVGGA
jgi:glycosyltransferase involved in cell wall biosynthesis